MTNTAAKQPILLRTPNNKVMVAIPGCETEEEFCDTSVKSVAVQSLMNAILGNEQNGSTMEIALESWPAFTAPPSWWFFRHPTWWEWFEAPEETPDDAPYEEYAAVLAGNKARWAILMEHPEYLHHEWLSLNAFAFLAFDFLAPGPSLVECPVCPSEGDEGHQVNSAPWSNPTGSVIVWSCTVCGWAIPSLPSFDSPYDLYDLDVLVGKYWENFEVGVLEEDLTRYRDSLSQALRRRHDPALEAAEEVAGG